LIRELFEVYKLVEGRIQFELVQKITLKEILKIQSFFYNEILKINEEKRDRILERIKNFQCRISY
jgi:hypothetical protein